MVVPFSKTIRKIGTHFQVDPPEGGLTDRSYILCDAVPSIAKERLGARPWGVVSAQTLAQVEDYLRILLEL